MDELDALRRNVSIKEARDQAAEATGFLSSVEIVVGDETNGTTEAFEIPQRGLFDDEQRERMDELDLESESWDREPDIQIPERQIRNVDDDGNEELIIIPATTRPGSLKVPYRKTDSEGNVVLIRPTYPVQVAIALWGEEKYNRFKKAGGSATIVTATLAALDKKLEKREAADPKSKDGAGKVEPRRKRT